MELKYFLHRIKKDGDTFTKGIEVHDTQDSAIRSYHAQMTQAFGNQSYPDVSYVNCRITDIYGNTLFPFKETWNPEAASDKIFLHYIRKDGETYTKNIDVLDTLDAAKLSYHQNQAYGHNNPKFANVEYVSCFITDMNGNIIQPYAGTWLKEDVTPTVIEGE